MSHVDDVIKIAEVAHEVNRAFCQGIGDSSQVSWEEAPDWQKDSAVQGVLTVLDNPDITPEDTHAKWSEVKLRDGWKYGPVKDADKKEHPCLVPYSELPQDQRVKDYLFKAVIVTVNKILSK